MTKPTPTPTPWARIFNADILHEGDVIDYTQATPVDRSSPSQRKIYKEYYRATIVHFNDAKHTVSVQMNENEPIYTVYNGPYRRDILRVVQKNKSEVK